MSETYSKMHDFNWARGAAKFTYEVSRKNKESYQYQVDLQTFTQTNLSTGKSRSVRYYEGKDSVGGEERSSASASDRRPVEGGGDIEARLEHAERLLSRLRSIARDIKEGVWAESGRICPQCGCHVEQRQRLDEALRLLI